MDINILIKWLTIIIPAMVTIIGLFFTVKATRRNFVQEICKQKTKIYLDKLANAPIELLEFVFSIKNGVGEADISKFSNKYQNIMNKISAYGTEDAIKIAAALQQNSFRISNENAGDKDKVMPYTILLICQLKYDMTDIAISPNYLYETMIIGYDKTQGKYQEKNNQIVHELQLDEAFLIC